MVQVIEGGNPFASLLGGGVRGFSQVASQAYQSKLEDKRKKQSEQDLVNAFGQLGIPENEAKLYKMLTAGGQTELVKSLLESKKRGLLGEEGKSQSSGLAALSESSEGNDQNLDNVINQIQSEQDAGLTPAERVRRQSERFKLGNPVFTEASKKLTGFARDKERLSVLEKLDKSGKLPKNLSRLNVDKEGNLRLPFLASPEAQRYVKTLNEFSQNAKETYGARVTNFDLQQFLKRFPTLMNTSDGRKQIIQQMKIVNDINAVYYKNLKKVYEKAGGVRNIDPDQAQMLAEKLSDPKIQELSERFERIGQFSSLPSAEEHKGRTIQDDKTGEVLQSDGQNWVPVE